MKKKNEKMKKKNEKMKSDRCIEVKISYQNDRTRIVTFITTISP
jgi:hypothetical protein